MCIRDSLSTLTVSAGFEIWILIPRRIRIPMTSERYGPIQKQCAPLAEIESQAGRLAAATWKFSPASSCGTFGLYFLTVQTGACRQLNALEGDQGSSSKH